MSKHKMRGPMGGGPMGGMARGGEKAKDFKKTMKTLGKYLKPYSLSIIIVIIFAIGSAAFSIVGPKILGEATTEIFNGLVKKVTTTNAEGINFTRIGEIILFLVGLYLVSVIFSLIQGWVMSGIAQKVSYNMRKEISEKINRMPLKYFDTKTHGEVLSRVTNDVDTVSQTLNQSLSQMLTSATTLVGVLIMMFSINWIMTLASLIVIPVSAGLIAFVVKKSQRYFKTQQEYLGYVNGQVEEVYSGHNVMKAFNAEEREIDKFNELNDTLYNSAWKSQFLSGMMMPIMTFVGNLGYVIVSILGGWLAIKKVIEVGDILSFVQYIRSFMQPIAQTAQIANVMQQTAAAAERVFEFLEEEEVVEDVKDPISIEGIEGAVEFEHVRFGYNEDKIIISSNSSIPIYEQINTQIKAMIVSEELKHEELLPSVRNLARQLHISVITVKRAYEDLQNEGFVKTVVGKGTFVIAQENVKREKINTMIEEKLDEIVSLAKQNGIKVDTLQEILNMLYYGEE